MTVIRDPAVPKVEGEVRPAPNELRMLDRVMTGRRLVVLLGVSALVLTGVNFVASARLAVAISDLRAAEERLQDLAGLEKRLKGSLEMVNTGIQTQIETLDRDFHDKITGLEDGVGEIQRRLDKQATTGMVGLTPLPGTDLSATAEAPPPELAPETAEVPSTGEQPEATAGEPAEDMPVAAIKPKPRKPAKPPQSKVGSAYQRIETPDGKVYYRRVQ